MTKEMIVYNCFNGGVISDDLNARFELPIYKTSLSDSKNMISNFTGVLKNRTGFERVAVLDDKCTLKEFKFSQEQSYLLVHKDNKKQYNFYTYDSNGKLGVITKYVYGDLGEEVKLPDFTSNEQDGFKVSWCKGEEDLNLYNAYKFISKDVWDDDEQNYGNGVIASGTRDGTYPGVSYLYYVNTDYSIVVEYPEPVFVKEISHYAVRKKNYCGDVEEASIEVFLNDRWVKLKDLGKVTKLKGIPTARNWIDVGTSPVFSTKWRYHITRFVSENWAVGVDIDFKAYKVADSEAVAVADDVSEYEYSIDTKFINSSALKSYAQNGDALFICDGYGIYRLQRLSATTFIFDEFKPTGLPEDWGMPRACAFWGGRLWLAGFEKTPQGICASEVGNYENFTLTTENIKDTDPLQLIANDLEERIFWLIPGNDVLNAGSHEGVAAIKGAEGVVSPTGQASAKCTKTSDKGSREVNPITKDNFVFYSSQDGRHLYSYIYDLLSEAYNVQDKNIISKETTAGIIKRIVYKRDDNDLIYILLENGKMLAYSFNKDENINGFYPIETYGFIEDIECVTRPDGKHDLFAIITDDEARRFLCRLTDEVEFTKFSDKETKENHRKCVSIWNNELRKANYLDNSIYYSEPHKEAITISNKNVYLPNPQAGFIHDLTNLEIVDNHLKIKDGKSINVAFPCDNAKGYKNIVIKDTDIGQLSSPITDKNIFCIEKDNNSYSWYSDNADDFFVVDSEKDIDKSNYEYLSHTYYCRKEHKIIRPIFQNDTREYSYPVYAFINELKTVVDNGQEKFEENIAYEQGILNNCNYFEIPQDIYLLDFAETKGAEVVGMEGKHIYAHQDGQDYYYEIVQQINDPTKIYDEKVIEDASGVTFGDADYVVIRYLWTDGRDLDTDTRLTNATDNTINNIAVGWSRESQVPVGSNIDNCVLYWTGDNTSAGTSTGQEENILINLKNLTGTYSEALPDMLKIQLQATWYAEVGHNIVKAQIVAYKGGTMSYDPSASGTDRYVFKNTGGQRVELTDSAGNKTDSITINTTRVSETLRQYTTIANYFYDKTTGKSYLLAEGQPEPTPGQGGITPSEQVFATKGYALARLCSDRPINKLENWYLSFDKITGITDFGDSCTVVGDGVNLGELQVNEGYIALPRYCFTAIIGKPYETYANTMFIGNGIDQIYNKNVYRMTVRLKNTVGGKIGVDPLHLHAFQQIKQDSYYDLQYIMTSDIDIRPDDESKELKKLYMIQDIPLPFQINMVMLETEARRL